MILTLKLPTDIRSARRFAILTWHKSEGDAVAFGDEICEVRVSAQLRLEMDYKSSNSVVSVTRDPKLTHKEVESRAVVKITSAESGYLRRICAATGTEAGPGDRIALLTYDNTPAQLDCAVPTESSKDFRTSAEVLGAFDEE